MNRRVWLRRWLPLWSMMALALIGLLVFFVYPLIANLYYSFTSYDLVTPPHWIGLKNYVFMFTKDPFIKKAAWNTFWFVIVLVPIRIVSALALAMLLTRRKRATGLWRTLFYVPALIPPVASVVAFVFLFNPGNGPVNKILGLVGINGPMWFNSAATSKPTLLLLGVWVAGDIMVIFLASLLDVPREQYEVASLDGANGRQQFWYITVPFISPVLLFALVTGIIGSLQYFTEAAVASMVASGKTGIAATQNQLLGYPGNSLLTYTQWMYSRGFASFQLGYAAAMAVILFIVAAAVMAVLLRRISVFSIDGK